LIGSTEESPTARTLHAEGDGDGDGDAELDEPEDDGLGACGLFERLDLSGELYGPVVKDDSEVEKLERGLSELYAIDWLRVFITTWL
jgi:hypothetical protein